MTCVTNSSRPRHTTIAKEDKMLELRQREESVNQAQEVIRADDSYVTLGADDTDVTQTVDDVYEEIYVSKLWRNVDESKVCTCSMSINLDIEYCTD